ncbi:hypothetical protein LCGC14_1335310 [marine sediment metagenome]|uniref:Uncharacterized protein n=1 Tax=marine sediment metagenome TaxID=412755 RepID=A0A0F9L1E1_9ZZZZ
MASTKRQEQRAKRLVQIGRNAQLVQKTLESDKAKLSVENHGLLEKVTALSLATAAFEAGLAEAKATIALQATGITDLESSRERRIDKLQDTKKKLSRLKDGFAKLTADYGDLLKLDHEAAPLRRRLQTAKDELRLARSEILGLKARLRKAGEDFF